MLHLKLAAETSRYRRRKVARAARRAGASRMRQLFPDAEDELATLYVVDVPDGVDGDAVASALRGEAAVDSVEIAPPRWLA